MRIEDDGLVIEAGPGSRQQALDYGIARFQEREKTKRHLSALVAFLVVAADALVIFAPTGRGNSGVRTLTRHPRACAGINWGDPRHA